MKGFSAALVAAFVVLACSASAQAADGQLDIYSGTVDSSAVGALNDLGLDRHEGDLRIRNAGAGKVHLEAVLNRRQVAALRKDGIVLRTKKVDGQSVAQRATALAADGYEVFRKYLGPDGLKEDLEQSAREHRRITKLINIGQTVNGTDILVLKIAKNADQRDGKKPSVFYFGAQHAREWITPEMIRRLKDHILEQYDAGNPRIRRLVDERELYFMPVANPDGYDFTFNEGQRLWRKNLRDNDGDGQITDADGVDLNRNMAYKWGYDNEGSSPDPGNLTYRGPGPNSEPETQAIDRFVAGHDFDFLINYHSAAQLLLYGIGWQVATPAPDDIIYEALAGDDAEPAVPGYDPDLSAELYTTNGDTDTHMQELYGTLGFTPEMSTCTAAAASDPDDEWEPDECIDDFIFPDDETLVQAEFAKNVPFALSVAESADDPDDPESVVNRDAEPFRVDTFDRSHGGDQTVAVWAKRALKRVEMHYRINGRGRIFSTGVSEWDGGERYGHENNRYYGEFRAKVRGADEGDEVRVWFSGFERDNRGRTKLVESERFEYDVETDTRADVLVIANEDYTGVNPTYPGGTDAPKYLDQHVEAIEAAGYDADTWDVDADGVPHDLGVLSHYDAVVWYLGDNRITQDPEDELIQTVFGPLPDIGVAERQQYLTIAVRDYLNEGGKLIHAGETAQYGGLPGISDVVGGLYYGLNGDETAECVVSSGVQGFFDDCLIMADDFRQYWLGGFTRFDFPDPERVAGVAFPLEGYEAMLGGPVVEGGNPLDEAGAFQPTSEVLPVEEFPQFASQGAVEYPIEGGPFTPVEGERYAGAVHQDESYTRLTKTVDLRNVTAAQTPQLQFQLSLDSEPGYDFVLVEARTAGQDNWTTLSERNGRSTNQVPSDCPDEFLLEMHPFLGHYLTQGDPCTNTGTSGQWNGITGSTEGWQQVAFDLAAYAGQQVELNITYMSDPSTGGVGAFVDDTRIVVGGATVEADGFEGATSTWAVTGPPEGSPAAHAEWEFGGQLVNFFAGTSTEDTLLLGFGLEHLATDEDRAELLEQTLDNLIP